MNSRVSWSNEGIDPSIRERAEAAARRAGMSLNEWLNSTLGDFNPTDFRSLYDQGPAQESSHQVADIHGRLDAIARQIERISQAIPRNDAPRGELLRSEAPVAQRLNDAIARLDARLAQISSPGRQPSRMEPEIAERVANQVYRTSPPLSPTSLDFAIPETTARQSDGDDLPPQREVPPRSAPITASIPQTTSSVPAAASAAAGPDFSSLERYLLKITSQIEAMQCPDHIEQSIAAFRSELSEIRLAITEAMPRRAIESIESEIRALAMRIDDSRQCGIDTHALTGIERALSEIREVLRSLTPAEQLAGYDEAIRNLTAKLDEILRANDDPSTIRQLEGAIAALRGIVANVASNDALARLSEDVHVLSSKVDQLARADRSDSLAIIEQRLAALTSSFESREHQPPIHDNSEQIENALRALSDRIDRMPVRNDNYESVENALRALADRFDRMPVGSDNASALAHLEQRVTYLLERLESTADHRTGNFGRVEEGLQDVLHQLERQHASIAALAGNSRSEPASDGGFTDLVKRELSDIRFSQSETDRHTQGSLEAVHNTLGHVVDRLALIEGDLRSAHAQPAVPRAEEPARPDFSAPAALAHEVLRSSSFEAPLAPMQAEPPTAAIIAQGEPDLPDPAPAQNHFDAAPREFHSVSAVTPPAATVIPQAISEILEPHTAPSYAANQPALPPDHPLEPGTRPSGRAGSPSERIAASESAIREIVASPREPVSTSSFIAAARRAAQAAAAAPPAEKAGRGAAKKLGGKVGGTSTITSKIRSLLVGASVVVIVLGTFRMAMTLLDTGAPLQMPAMENAAEPQSSAKSSAEDAASPAMPAQLAPMTSPAPIGKQSFNNYMPDSAEGTASIAIPQNIVAPSPSSTNDVTGTIPLQSTVAKSKLSLIPIPPSEHLPDAIGGAVLRSAALKGDPTAAYEVAVRFAEGKGVAANYDEAVKWLDRAAQAGVVPAIFRLGTFYEKGLAVTRDIAIARHYYVQAADRGNAKAMHNLAVLDADGGGKGADYRSAVQWFRKAADRGVADSQYNLGILYARGIGIEQNLAESFKWFSLAAAQGDADAARKRDDVASRLDPQSLAAAKLAIQTFTPEPQPDDAVNVAAPAGGWDSAPAQATPAKPLVKPPSKRTASVH
jgi:localization factor PodJL